MKRFLLLSFLSATSCFAQGYQLHYTFPTGKTLRYRQVETEKGYAQSQMGLNVEMNRKIESLFDVSLERTDGDLFVLRIVQDTAIVDEQAAGSGQSPMPDIPNTITGKPVLVTMDAHGRLRSLQPTFPLRDATFPAYLSDNILARRAMIFTLLPSRTLSQGLSWTEKQSDTTRPSQEIPGLGRGQGVRYSTAETRFEVKDSEVVEGYNCVVLSWKSIIFVESKMLFQGTDVFNEDRTEITGTLYFAPKEGLLTAVNVKTALETTRVIYGTTSEISPSSTQTELTLRLIK